MQNSVDILWKLPNNHIDLVAIQRSKNILHVLYKPGMLRVAKHARLFAADQLHDGIEQVGDAVVVEVETLW